MNRKIQFRGKRIDNGQWIEGSLVHNIIGDVCFIKESEFSSKMEVFRHTIGEYVTWCGEECCSVYEGDIVNFKSFIEPYNCGVIGYRKLEWILESKSGDKLLSLSEIDYDDWDQAEVVGNIFDNPELIKKKEE